jgi:hypothetical protein
MKREKFQPLPEITTNEKTAVKYEQFYDYF